MEKNYWDLETRRKSQKRLILLLPDLNTGRCTLLSSDIGRRPQNLKKIKKILLKINFWHYKKLKNFTDLMPLNVFTGQKYLKKTHAMIVTTGLHPKKI